MFAIGGNLYQDVGGIYSSTNAGLNWNLDMSTGAEMFSYDFKKISNDSIDMWCVGSTGSGSGYIGKLFKVRIGYNLVGINNISNQIPNEYKLYQNYPNPFNSMTKIQWSMYNSGNVKLIIYDLQGKEMVTLVNGKYQAGNYEIKWDGNKYSSGIYFYKLITDRFTDTKKMVLLK